jgi:aspartyl-tRNA(Asn)/glutamyl-tRNA(Gln) amidotransferase subunit B
MNYKTLVGLEIHAELATASKMFCGCTTTYGGDVNTHCCPICLGLPGTLPVVNKRAIEFAIQTGLAFNAKIAKISKMDRKNYFYPDLVKAFQISQYDMPLCEHGHVDIETSSGKKRIGIQRIHLEEDTGKSLHAEDGSSLLDYNRCGVPLIEIVTLPDLSNAEEAGAFLDRLKATLEYIEVSDCKMEQGSLRCDVNVNVVSEDGSVKTNITEIKNLNSFKAAMKAIDYETRRHIAALERGENTLKETRRWDDAKNETFHMRTKEFVQDYRYFPEPDIVDFEIDADWIERLELELPELPQTKRLRFISEYGIPEYDAGVLTSTRQMAAYFETLAERAGDPKLASNWIMTELMRRLKEEDLELDALRFSIEAFAELISMVRDGTLNQNAAKKVFRRLFEEGGSPKAIVESEGLAQQSDANVLKEAVEAVLKANPQSIEDFRNGKDRAFGFLVGQVMKASKGKANPQVVNELLTEALKRQ